MHALNISMDYKETSLFPIHDIRDFPQAKLGSEINARYPLNGHGDLYFYCIYFGVKNQEKNCLDGSKKFKFIISLY